MHVLLSSPLNSDVAGMEKAHNQHPKTDRAWLDKRHCSVARISVSDLVQLLVGLPWQKNKKKKCIVKKLQSSCADKMTFLRGLVPHGLNVHSKIVP